jgi:membrane protein YdbS with pleckstrin-like domain
MQNIPRDPIQTTNPRWYRIWIKNIIFFSIVLVISFIIFLICYWLKASDIVTTIFLYMIVISGSILGTISIGGQCYSIYRSWKGK